MTQFTPRVHPAQAAMRAWAGEQTPDVWNRLADARMDGPRDTRYYVPVERLFSRLPPPREGNTAAWADNCALASGWAAWRMTQGVYRFDPTIYAPLLETPIERIPVDTLDRLPEWAVYLETPDFAPPLTRGHRVHGVLAWRNRLFDGQVDAPLEVLMLVLFAGLQDGVDYDRQVLVMPLADTLDESIERRAREAALTESLLGTPGVSDSEADALRQTLPPIISLLLYLCADDPDIVGKGAPGNPEPKRTRKGTRLFPAEGLRKWDVGLRLGAALRQAYHAVETNQAKPDPTTGRASPRAHVRRAHWHTFLSGVGRTERRLKWLPPIPVNVDAIDAMPATVRPVK